MSRLVELGDREIAIESVDDFLARHEGRGAPPPLTDSGNAERLAKGHADALRFVGPWDKWLAWDGTHWTRDAESQALLCTKDVARAIAEEAAQESREKKRKMILGWAKRSESAAGRKAMLAMAKAERALHVAPDRLDADAWLLNVRNGTIDLRSGELRGHERKDLITKVVPTEFDPAAECPRWSSFLERVVPDSATRDYLQRAIGWTLSGDTNEQVILFCFGSGANGKSVFLRVLLDLLGEDYAIQGASDLLLAKQHRGHPTELTDLFGRRLVVCNEINANRSFDEALVKQLTGSDVIRARRMREDFWEFRPTHHLWVAANHRPTVRGNDHGIWRRIRLLPFEVTIPEAERDPGLLDKLREEASGILAWAVRGCLAWQKVGLAPPEQVQAATEAYREEMDTIGEFLGEAVVNEDSATVSAKDLFDAYRAWSEEHGERPLSQKRFGASLTERGIDRKKLRDGTHYIGVRIRRAGERCEPCERSTPSIEDLQNHHHGGGYVDPGEKGGRFTSFTGESWEEVL